MKKISLLLLLTACQHISDPHGVQSYNDALATYGKPCEDNLLKDNYGRVIGYGAYPSPSPDKPNRFTLAPGEDGCILDGRAIFLFDKDEYLIAYAFQKVKVGN